MLFLLAFNHNQGNSPSDLFEALTLYFFESLPQFSDCTLLAILMRNNHEPA